MKAKLKRTLQGFIETRLLRQRLATHNALVGADPFKRQSVCRAQACRDMCDFGLFLNKGGYEKVSSLKNSYTDLVTCYIPDK